MTSATGAGSFDVDWVVPWDASFLSTSEDDIKDFVSMEWQLEVHASNRIRELMSSEETFVLSIFKGKD